MVDSEDEKVPSTSSTSDRTWLNSNVLGVGLTSLFSDMSHEMATSILPFFVIFVLGGNAAVVGLIEGSADGFASLFKSYSGYHSDKSGKRLPIMYLGYLATGILIPAIGLATNLAEVFLLRVGAWIGRGARGPPRDALMTESVSPSSIGKAFGFERALDTLGAVVGPAIALLLIPYLSFSKIFFVSAIPGAVCVAVVFLLVREVRKKESDLKEGRTPSFSLTVRTLPKNFKLLLISVSLFGIANFSNVFFTLRAEQVLQPSFGQTQASELAVLLYVVLNIIYAVGCYPAGYFADRMSKRNLLALGYFVFALACVASIFESADYLILGTIFVLAGLQSAIVDTVEKTYASEVLGQSPKGTGFGVLQSINGIGDFTSSTLIGILIVFLSPAFGFSVVAIVALFSSLFLLISMKNGN
jgi:MFS family permease